MDDPSKSPVDRPLFSNDPMDPLPPKDYARQLSERKRLEEIKKKEDKFLRKSLRQSEKFRSLAKATAISKRLIDTYNRHDNLGFDGDEMNDYASEYAATDSGTFIRDLRLTLENRDVDEDSSDIDEHCDDEWEWLINKVSNKSILQTFNMHHIIATAFENYSLIMNGLPMEYMTGEGGTRSILNAVIWELKNITSSSYSADISELYELLRNPKIRGVLYAFDGVTRVWMTGTRGKNSEANLTKKTSPTILDNEVLERTVYPSPLDGCYKILAVDDNGNVISTADGTSLVNVVLQKSAEDYFGATVRTEGSAVVIGRIISGGLIERTGLLSEGDELLSVNGIDLVGKDVDRVSHILNTCGSKIDLLVAPLLPITEVTLVQEEPVAHMRALFSYEPTNDVYNPCSEAGLAFDKGDILRVLSLRDPNWWQALRIEETGVVGISRSMGGLIPSPYFQRYRSLLRLKATGAYEEDAAAGYSESEESDFELDALSSDLSVSGSPSTRSASNISQWSSTDALQMQAGGRLPTSSGLDVNPLWSSHGVGPKQLKKQKRAKKSLKPIIHGIFSGGVSRLAGGNKKRSNEYELSMEMNSLKQADGDQLRKLLDESISDKIRRPSLLTYELVDLYYPQPQRRRPLVLVGPTHVGRQQLIEALVHANPKRFAIPDIHTTNPEMHSTGLQHYETISKLDFQRLQHEKTFVEWGVYNRHYYGTKVSSIESIVKAGKVCVIALRPDSIRSIRRTPFFPCVIFISPPDKFEDLRKLRINLGQSPDTLAEELNSCIVQSQRMEQHYGHFFEFVIVPQTLDTAITELKQIALELERRPQWVPAHWIDIAWQVAAQAVREAGGGALMTDNPLANSTPS